MDKPDAGAAHPHPLELELAQKDGDGLVGLGDQGSECSLSAAFLFGGMICLLSLGLFALWGRRACPIPT